MISLILAAMIGDWKVGGFSGGGQGKSASAPFNPAKPVAPDRKPSNPIFPDKNPIFPEPSNPVFPARKPEIDGREVSWDGANYSVLTANGLYVYSHTDLDALTDQVRAYDANPIVWRFTQQAYRATSSCYTDRSGRRICNIR